MIPLLGENYFIDLDSVEDYLNIGDDDTLESSGLTETRINIIKFEMVKMLIETLLTESEQPDEKLGLNKSISSTSIAFRIAFNTLLNKKLINHY